MSVWVSLTVYRLLLSLCQNLYYIVLWVEQVISALNQIKHSHNLSIFCQGFWGCGEGGLGTVVSVCVDGCVMSASSAVGGGGQGGLWGHS